MSKLKTGFSLFITNPYEFLAALMKNIAWIFSDKFYVKVQYKAALGKYPNLDNPQTYTEKLQWLKLYNRKPEYTMMVDKYKVREYISDKLGEEFLIPLIGVWDKTEDIDFDKLPDQFVLKCNHTGGGAVFICKDKNTFNFKEVKKSLAKQLKTDTFLKTREWPYKDVKRKIICEKYMVDESGSELKDYKIFCFNGLPKFIEVDYDRFSNHKRNIYDLNWERLPFTLGFPTDLKKKIDKPENLTLMLELASKLANKIPHVRIDFYNINGRIYFGEITFFHGSGYEKFDPLSWDLEIGSIIKLDKV